MCLFLILDDVYLLQFLRVRKYSMDEAFQTIERAYLARKRYPQFFDFKVGTDEKVKQLFNTGYCYPLSERDKDGRRIILMQTRRLNTDIYSVYDAIRLFLYVATVLLEEEETQIAGLVFIFNHAGITLKHIMNPVDVRDFMEFVKNCSSGRIKSSYVANLPSFANFMMELFKTAMSEKLRKRLFILKNANDLKNQIDKSLLPKDYGGTRTEAEMMQDFIMLRDSKEELIRKIFDFSIDWRKVPPEKLKSNNLDQNVVGSFRKLEID